MPRLRGLLREQTTLEKVRELEGSVTMLVPTNEVRESDPDAQARTPEHGW